MEPKPTFQQIILRLQQYWSDKGCALLQPYDMEVGAGPSHTATFLRAIGPEPGKAAYVKPSRRTTDGGYGEVPENFSVKLVGVVESPEHPVDAGHGRG